MLHTRRAYIHDVDNYSGPVKDYDCAGTGGAELAIYSLCLCRAIQRRDPQCWQDIQFREFVSWNLRCSLSTYTTSLIFALDAMPKYLPQLDRLAECEELRQLAVQDLGVDLLDSVSRQQWSIE